MESFLTYGTQWIDAEDVKAVTEVLQSDFLTQGPKVEEFEQALARYCGARFCVAVANGTAGLHISVAALALSAGDEGITSTLSFAASANCLAYNGLTPLLADIRPDTYNLSAEDVERRITGRTRVLIPVHYAGQPADMAALHTVAKTHGLAVIEDAAHAIGSRYEDGSRVGSCLHSDMTVFSFHPVKTITTGEGGAVTTNSEKLCRALRLLRSHGITRDPADFSGAAAPWYYEMQRLGFNYRLTDLQAALGVSQLRKLDGFVQRRRQLVSRYNAAFGGTPHLVPPFERPGVDSAFHLYVLQIDFAGLGLERSEVMTRLRREGIGTQVHYIPIHYHPYYRDRYGTRRGTCPVAESFYERALSIPLYPKMTDKDQDKVIEAVKDLAR
jgi:UDP-4-amino-4,6-dideoxy-N-acetyl-beta-L-altrosamine transaminase